MVFLWIVFHVTTFATMTMTASAATATAPVADIATAARELARAARWQHATALLDATTAGDPHARAVLALAAADVAMERVWAGDAPVTAVPVARAARCCQAVADATLDWDLRFLRLRHDYVASILDDGQFRPAPYGGGAGNSGALRERAGALTADAPDVRRRGWAHMYRGLIADNVEGDRAAAPDHYAAALAAGESDGCGDGLLVREALRHLGDHDHDRGDHAGARERWTRATSVGARAGAVTGTLSQQLLLAVLARDAGDQAGAAALAGEIARWADAIGARAVAAQATGLLAGVDPTAPPGSEDA
jgi:hypothetical protein